MRELTCACGWRVRGTIEEVVAQVKAHGLEAHGEEPTREEILANSYPVSAADGA